MKKADIDASGDQPLMYHAAPYFQYLQGGFGKARAERMVEFRGERFSRRRRRGDDDAAQHFIAAAFEVEVEHLDLASYPVSE